MKTFKIISNSTVLLSQPVLIDAFGRTGAQFISQLHYWIEKQTGVLHEGMRWIYNTEKEWGQQIRLSERQIRFYVKKFKDLGILFVQKLHPKKSDRTNYFTLNYEKLFELIDFPHQEETASSSGRDCLFYNTKITNKDLNNKSEETFVQSQLVEQVIDFKNNNSEELNVVEVEISKKSHEKTSEPFETKEKSTTVQDMLAHWNKSFSKSETKLSKDLSRNLMGAFIHRFEKNMEKWQYYCATIASSSYLMGENFVLTLNWALKFSTIDRILKGELGVKEIVFKPSEENLEKKALAHIDGVGESDRCKQDRRLLIKAFGAAAYISWFTQVEFIEQEGRVVFKTNSKFVEDYVMQKFGMFLSNT